MTTETQNYNDDSLLDYIQAGVVLGFDEKTAENGVKRLMREQGLPFIEVSKNNIKFRYGNLKQYLKDKTVNATPKETPQTSTVNPVQKAKDEADIQVEETRKAKALQEKVFYENNIKDVNDLLDKRKNQDQTERDFTKQMLEWENNKKLELSTLQKDKSEFEKSKSELNKKEQDVNKRFKEVEKREQLVSEREKLMNKVEQQKLQDEEVANSLENRLKTHLNQILAVIGQNANIIIKSGFSVLGNGLWDEIETIQKSDNTKDNYTTDVINYLKGECEDCNKVAISMSREGYPDKSWEAIANNLESIYELLPEIKP